MLSICLIYGSVCLFLQLFVGCLIYVICVSLHIVVSNTYCIVLLVCLSSSCVPMLPVSLDCPFGLPIRYSLTCMSIVNASHFVLN